MMNSNCAPSLKWEYIDGQGFIFTATKDIKKDEALEFSYEKLNTTQLLFDYGYVQFPQEFETATLTLECPDKANDKPMGEIKAKILSPEYNN